MLQLIYRLAGVDIRIVRFLSKDLQHQYRNLAFALIITTIVAGFSGFDIALQFTRNYTICIGVGILWALVVFSFDYFLLNSDRKPSTMAVRIPIGIANVIITIAGLFIMFNQAKIDGILLLSNNSKVVAIDSTYFKAKEDRYKILTDRTTAIEEYHQAVCEPESRNGFAGPKYIQKHQFCETQGADLAKLRAQLDSIETSYYNVYQSQKNANNSVSTDDFFQKVKLLPEIITEHWIIELVALCLFLILCYVEVQAIVMKISLHKNTDYKTASDNFHNSIADNIKLEMANLADIDRNNISLSHNQIMKSKKIEELNQEYANNIILTEIHSKILLNCLIDEHIQNKLKAMSSEFGLHNSQALIENYLDLTKPKKNITESVETSKAIDNLFYLNPLVKQEITAIYQNFKDDKKQLVLNLFNWLVNAIEYDENHRDDIYRNATETFISGKGLCGEMAILLIAALRFFNINASFVEVTVDDKNKPVAHACVSVIINGREQLIDPAYKSFEIRHQLYKVLTDDELLERFRYWNRSRIEDYSIPLSTSKNTYPMPKSRLGSFLKRRKFNPSVADKKWVDENSDVNTGSNTTNHTETSNFQNERFVFPFDKLQEGFQTTETNVEQLRISLSKNNKK